MSSHGSSPAPSAILSKVFSETLPRPDIAYSSVFIGMPISFAYSDCVLPSSYILSLMFLANACLLSKISLPFLFSLQPHCNFCIPNLISPP